MGPADLVVVGWVLHEAIELARQLGPDTAWAWLSARLDVGLLAVSCRQPAGDQRRTLR